MEPCTGCEDRDRIIEQMKRERIDLLRRLGTSESDRFESFNHCARNAGKGEFVYRPEPR